MMYWNAQTAKDHLFKYIKGKNRFPNAILENVY